MRFEGYATCPGCGHDMRIGDFEGSLFLGVTDESTLVNKEDGITPVDSCNDFNVFRIICSECALIFYASSMVMMRIENAER